MKKNIEKKPSRKNPTWTFQVDPDVDEAFKKVFGDELETNRGKRSKVINEALRRKSDIAAAALALAEQELAANKKKIESLQKAVTEFREAEGAALVAKAIAGAVSEKHKSEGQSQ